METKEKLADIDSYVRTVLSNACQCSLGGNILMSFFTCPPNTPTDQVLYRATVRETEVANCTRLVTFLESSVQSDSASPLVVLGNILKIRQDCNAEAPFIDSDLVCPSGPTSATTLTGDNPTSQLGAIIGGAVAGVVVILLLVMLLFLVVACRRRRMMTKM